MNVHFEVWTTEITLNKEMTFYNHLWWSMKSNRYGITHFIEKYDDVCEHTASYEFFRDGEMLCSGEGDPIPQDKIGTGGVSVMVQIDYAEYMFK
jgi:hypothetical protein